MLIIISGPPASGKSSVSKALAKKLPKSAYISIDKMRDMIVGGNITPWDEGATKQFDLIEKNFLDLSKNFIANGFVVILDGVVGDEQVKKYCQTFTDVYTFLLLPSKETLMQRELKRDKNQEMRERIEVLYPEFANKPHGDFKVIDSTNLNLRETVNEILKYIS